MKKLRSLGGDVNKMLQNRQELARSYHTGRRFECTSTITMQLSEVPRRSSLLPHIFQPDMFNVFLASAIPCGFLAGPSPKCRTVWKMPSMTYIIGSKTVGKTPSDAAAITF